MACLIHFCKKLIAADKRNRIIIFSQWDKMLEHINATLKTAQVKSMFCQGNVWMRNKAIRSFQGYADIRVMLLSLGKAASGTNLTEATHVILIDPVAGTKEEANAIEMQAIGRAHPQGQKKEITVVRFIVKDTVEEALYHRNMKEKK